MFLRIDFLPLQRCHRKGPRNTCIPGFRRSPLLLPFRYMLHCRKHLYVLQQLLKEKIE